MEPSDDAPYPEGQAGLRVRVAPGGSQSLFEILDRRGEVLAHIVLETPELDILIRTLADLRTALSDPVPASLDPGARLVALANPAWQVKPPAPGTGQDGAVLALRHSGLGWLGFLLSRAEAATLGYSLVQLAQRGLRAEPATLVPVAVPPAPPQA